MCRRVISLRSDANSSDLLFHVHPITSEDANRNAETAGKETEDEKVVRDKLSDYFYLHLSLNDLYQQWAESDPIFKQKALHLKGIRMLRIDPVENLFSFICSSNNNIPRITQMIEKMSREFGQFVGRVHERDYYTFPQPTSLVGSESKLRELGFGYRAKYISQTAQTLLDLSREAETTPEHFLLSLRSQPYETVHETLLKFSGVGPKVADCICLMSMDKSCAIPVDTHVRAIAERDYGVRVAGTTLTPAGYQKIVSAFRDRFGEHCGWAHSVLFTADLRWIDFQKQQHTQDENDPIVSVQPPKKKAKKRRNS